MQNEKPRGIADPNCTNKRRCTFYRICFKCGGIICRLTLLAVLAALISMPGDIFLTKLRIAVAIALSSFFWSGSASVRIRANTTFEAPSLFPIGASTGQTTPLSLLTSLISTVASASSSTTRTSQARQGINESKCGTMNQSQPLSFPPNASEKMLSGLPHPGLNLVRKQNEKDRNKKIGPPTVCPQK